MIIIISSNGLYTSFKGELPTGGFIKRIVLYKLYTNICTVVVKLLPIEYTLSQIWSLLNSTAHSTLACFVCLWNSLSYDSHVPTLSQFRHLRFKDPLSRINL